VPPGNQPGRPEAGSAWPARGGQAEPRQPKRPPLAP
jgi:hypothetical protein